MGALRAPTRPGVRGGPTAATTSGSCQAEGATCHVYPTGPGSCEETCEKDGIIVCTATFNCWVFPDESSDPSTGEPTSDGPAQSYDPTMCGTIEEQWLCQQSCWPDFPLMVSFVDRLGVDYCQCYCGADSVPPLDDARNTGIGINWIPTIIGLMKEHIADIGEEVAQTTAPSRLPSIWRAGQMIGAGSLAAIASTVFLRPDNQNDDETEEDCISRTGLPPCDLGGYFDYYESALAFLEDEDVDMRCLGTCSFFEAFGKNDELGACPGASGSTYHCGIKDLPECPAGRMISVFECDCCSDGGTLAEYRKAHWSMLLIRGNT